MNTRIKYNYKIVIFLATMALFAFSANVAHAVNPTITSIVPDNAQSNNQNQTITIDGSDFIPTAYTIIEYITPGGTAWVYTILTTTFNSSNQLTAVIPPFFFDGQHNGPSGTGLLHNIRVNPGPPTGPQTANEWNSPLNSNIKTFTIFAGTASPGGTRKDLEKPSWWQKLIAPVVNGITFLPLKLFQWSSNIILHITRFAALFAEFILEEFLNIFRNDPNCKFCITKNPTLIASWSMARDWANMLVVLGFIGIALLMVLKLGEYNTKKLLGGIILVALLVNFSGVLVGLAIDVSNIIMNFFLNNRGRVGISDNIKKIQEATAFKFNVGLSDITNANSDNFFGRVATYTALNFIFIVMFILTTFMILGFILVFIERYVFLALLFIVSPLALVFWALPIKAAKDLFSAWVHKLIEWCTAGIIVAFFLYLTAKMLSTFELTTQIGNVTSSMGPRELAPIIVPVTINLIVLLMFMFIGLKTAAKSSMLAKSVIGMAKAAVGLAGGAILAAGTSGTLLALKKGGGERVWNRTKELGSAALVKAGLRSQASHDVMRQKTAAPTKDEQEKIDKMSPEELKRYSEGAATRFGAPTAGAQRMKAAATAKRFERGLMSNVSLPEQEKLAKEAIAVDKSYASTIAKASPDLAHLNVDAMEEEKQRMLYKNSATLKRTDGTAYSYSESDMNDPRALGFNALQEEAKERVIRKAASTADKKFATEAADQDLLTMVDEKGFRGAAATDELVKREQLHTHPNGKTPENINNLLKNTDKHGLSTRRLYEKQDVRMKGYSEDTEKKVAEAKETAQRSGGTLTTTEEQKIRQNAVTEGTAKLTGNDLLKMPKEILADKNVFNELLKSPEKLRFAMERGSNVVREAISDGIIQNISDNMGTIKPDELAERLSIIPKNTNMAEIMQKQTPKIQQKLKEAFGTKEMPATVMVTRPTTKEDIDKAKAEKARDIEKLRKEGYMPSEKHIEVSGKAAKAFGETPKTSDEFYREAIERKNEQSVTKAKQDAALKTDPQKRIEDIKSLRGEGLMITEEEREARKQQGVEVEDLDKSYEIAVKKRVAKRTAETKARAAKPIEIPGTTISETITPPEGAGGGSELRALQDYSKELQKNRASAKENKRKIEAVENFLKGL